MCICLSLTVCVCLFPTFQLAKLSIVQSQADSSAGKGACHLLAWGSEINPQDPQGRGDSQSCPLSSTYVRDTYTHAHIPQDINV